MSKAASWSRRRAGGVCGRAVRSLIGTKSPALAFYAPWFLFAWLVFSFLFFPDGPFQSFRAGDTDDYMRLVRVEALLKGQGWFDHRIARLGGAEGTVLPWSRLADMPLYLVARFFSLWMETAQALKNAGLVAPLLLAAFLIPLGRRMARPFVSKARAFWVPVLLLSFVHPLMAQFSPSRVDHHAIYLLLSGLAFACLTRMIVLPRAFWPPVVAAAASALGLWVGGEAIPFLLLFGAAAGFTTAWRGGEALRSASRYGALLGLFTAALLPLALPVAAWRGHEITWFSGAYVTFALLMGAVLFFLGWIGRDATRRWLRLALWAALSFFFGTLFLLAIPEALEGPFANFDSASASMVLGHVAESQPLLAAFRSLAHPSGESLRAMLALFLPMIPVLASPVALCLARGRRRSRLLLLAAFFVVSFGCGALFWQRRVYTYAQLFAAPLIAWLLGAWLTKIGAAFEGRKRFAAESFAVLALTFLSSAWLPDVLLQKPVFPDSAFFYASPPRRACDPTAAARFLGDPSGFGARPRTVLSSMNDGPALLFFTPHRVWAAPYNVATNKAVFDFFNEKTNDPPPFDVDLVLVCRLIPSVYGRQTPPSLIERLAAGEPPPWLRRVASFTDSGEILYERAREGAGK